MTDADELRRIARRLNEMADAHERDREMRFFRNTSREPPAFADSGYLLQLTRALILSRRAREKYFEKALFADPAWDMLLDLYVCKLLGRRVATTDLCVAAEVPPTTALRWISVLVSYGLIRRESDPTDHRRKFLSLTPESDRSMARLILEISNLVRASRQVEPFMLAQSEP